MKTDIEILREMFKESAGFYQHRNPGIHDRPEQMLKMGFGTHQLNRLIGSIK